MVHITVWGDNGVESRMTTTFEKFVGFLDSHSPKNVKEVYVEGYADPRVFIVREDYKFIVKMTSKQFYKLKSKLEVLNEGKLENVYRG